MESTYATVLNFFTTHLQKFGVKKPTATSGLGQALCCLYENVGKAVHIDAIRSYVKEHGITLKGGGDPLQVRHLALQQGYNVLKGGEIHPVTGEKIPQAHVMLLDLEKPHPSYTPKRRICELNTDEWTSIKEHYENRCVNCGSEEGKPLRWNKYQVTVLEKGHMDPRKQMTSDNIIPQCSFCNDQYKNKAVFNERGVIIDFNKAGFMVKDVSY